MAEGVLHHTKVSSPPRDSGMATGQILRFLCLYPHVWHIYLHEWLIVMVNAGKYPIHRWYGIFEKCTNWKTLIIARRSMRFIGYIKDKH